MMGKQMCYWVKGKGAAIRLTIMGEVIASEVLCILKWIPHMY